MSNQFVATHENEWDGKLYSDSEWKTYKDDAVDAQRQALADAISYASNSPDGSNWDAIYNHLANVGTKGGNADFGWQKTLERRQHISLGEFTPLHPWNRQRGLRVVVQRWEHAFTSLQ